jgi:hypothetical protein
MPLLNEALRPFISKFVVVYFDDIMIYNKSLTEYLNHLHAIFRLCMLHSHLVTLRGSLSASNEYYFLAMLWLGRLCGREKWMVEAGRMPYKRG